MGDKDFISRSEHEEFAKRVEAENKRQDDEDARQNARIAKLEESVEKMTALTISVEKMALSVEQMAKELKSQGERLEAIESKPAKRWDLLVSGVIGAVAAMIGSGVMAVILGAVK